MQKETLAKILTYFGTLPFLGFMSIKLFNPEFLGFDYHQIILMYGAVIASFIAGTHWSIYLLKDAPQNLFIHSNIVALLAWGAALFSGVWAFSIFILCFCYLLLIDKHLANQKIIEDWYMRLRLNATIIVITALLFTCFI